MLHGDSSYELRGRFGAERTTEAHLELRDGIPGTTSMSAEGGQQVGALHSDDLVVAEDGTFAVTFDSEPAGELPQHVQIASGTTTLMLVRDLLDDWSRDLPTELELERTGPSTGQQPAGEDELAERAAELTDTLSVFWLHDIDQFYWAREDGVVRPARQRPGGRGLSTGASFDLADDEALVLTLDPLGAQSLGVQISDPWGVAYEYIERTSSLSATQAAPNADGTVTFVVARLDPGVRNWLDPQDQPGGLLAARWQSLPAGVSLDDDTVVPVRSSGVVPLAELDRHLPEGTRRIDTEERRRQQSERAAAYRRRCR